MGVRPVAAVSVLFLAVSLVALAQEQPSALNLERIKSATVFVMQARDLGDRLVLTCVGSGTLVSRSGLILTSAHSVVPSRDCPGETLLVGLLVRSDEPPVPKFRAEVVQVDFGLDLALLRIAQHIDGRLIPDGELFLPFVELADSSAVRLDETVVVVGFPGIGQDPVAVERGTVQGFVAEPSGGDRSWIKTGAPVRGTMSGGGAYNLEGQLVGVPITTPLVTGAFGVNCQVVQDTNDDDLVNSVDACVPIGGFINSLRPSDLARPLLRSATLGLTVELLSEPRVEGPLQAAVTPAVSRMFFSSSVIDGVPATVVRSLPVGSGALYLFLDYANMTSDTVYELRVTIDGVPNQTFSLSPVRWSGGERGLWYIGTSGQPLPNGVYEFTLVINGIASETKRLVVGGPPENAPTFSNIVFGLEDLRGNVLGNGYVLPTGSTATGRFIYQNMSEDLQWTAVWFYNGSEIFRTPPSAWTAGESGSQTTRIQDVNGLQPGSYRLELYIGVSLAATADFIIAGAQQGAFPLVFSNVNFVTGSDLEDALHAEPVTALQDTRDALYTVFDWQQLAPDTPWLMRWSVDGEAFFQETGLWRGSQSGENYLTQLVGSQGIPDGTYRLDLFVGQVPLASTQVQVGIGQLPIDRLAQTGGVQLRGQVLDAYTRQGIPGVTLMLLSAEYSVEDFDWNEDKIFALAVTDRTGRFQIERPLEIGAPYSVIIAADGYLPITADDLEVTAATDNPLELTIEMTRG